MKAPRIRPSLVAVLAKSAKLVSLLKLAKFTKVLVTATTLLLSVLLYALYLDPWMSIGLIAMLFIHEMGHVAAMRYRGMATPLMVFLPPLGAMLAVRQDAFGSRNNEAMIAIAGPFIGALATFGCIWLWWATGSQRVLLTGFFSAYLNLFNLIPMRPLDGGRIIQAVGEQFKYLGLLLLGCITIWLGQPSLVLIWVLVLGDFERMPSGMRVNIAGGLTLGMTALFVLGYGAQPPLFSVIDIVMASLFVYLYWLRDRDQDIIPHDLIRPYPPVVQRLAWVAAYFVLASWLWLMLWYILSHVQQP